MTQYNRVFFVTQIMSTMYQHVVRQEEVPTRDLASKNYLFT